jgi:hypothetical protein
MKNHRSMLGAMGFVLLCAIIAVPAAAQDLTATFTPVNVPGAVQTWPGGINNAGTMVGYYLDSSGAYHGYILEGTNLTTLDDPNGTNTEAFGLNLNGAIQVVGSYVNESGVTLGFLYKDGTYTDIPAPSGVGGVVSSGATGVNDAGVIVGDYMIDTVARHLHVISRNAYLLSGASYTTLDAPGNDLDEHAVGINNKGIAVLWWTDASGNTESSTYNVNTGAYTTINVPGAVNSEVLGIDDAGDMTYYWSDSAGAAHAAVFSGGKYYNFEYPGSVYTAPAGINDEGMLVGWYETVVDGPVSGFEATGK